MIRILVVDDDPCMREVVVSMLDLEFDAEIVEAHSGNAAICLLKQGNRFDIIISDYQMVDGDGGSLLDFIRKASVPSLFLFFTSSADDRKLDSAPNGKFLGIVKKERPKKLIEAVHLGFAGPKARK